MLNSFEISSMQVNNPNDIHKTSLVNFECIHLATSNGLIYINIDDEVNIQSMHALLFSKLDIQLNCFSTELELKNAMLNIYSQHATSSIQPLTVLLLDHVLDRKTGLDL